MPPASNGNALPSLPSQRLPIRLPRLIWHRCDHADMASSFTVALLAAALLFLPASPAADAAAAKAVRGSTVFFSFYSNTLLVSEGLVHATVTAKSV